MSEKIPERMITQPQIEDSLRDLGVKPGMTLLVHSSMKKIGWIPGGARSVVEALLAVLGPDGTLVMPAQTGENSDPAFWRHPPVPEYWWDEIRRVRPPYDPVLTPTRKMGAVVECFRAYPGVLRSSHPTCSFIARGPAAAAILSRHDLNDSLGEHSPCGALASADAHVLLLGVDFDNCTIMHLAEYRAKCRTMFTQSATITRDGQRENVTYPDIDMNSDEFLEPGRELEAAGLVRQGKIGEADLRLFKVRDAVSVAENWLRKNRMRRLDESDRERVMSYLKQEPEYNLFLIGDIENFGMSTDFQDIMAFEKDGEIDSILLRYHHSFIPYSRNPEFDTAPLLSALDTPVLHMMSGKKSVIDRLMPHLEGFDYKSSYLMKLGRGDLIEGDNRPEPEGVVMSAATLDDVPAMVDFVSGVVEFTHMGTRQERITQMITSFEKNAIHYYLYKYQDQVIAIAGTTAENSISAMVVSVATDPAWRGRGLASRLVTALAENLLADQLEYLCLFYNNPEAGRIYRRLGFKDAGEWIMVPRAEKETEAATC